MKLLLIAPLAVVLASCSAGGIKLPDGTVVMHGNAANKKSAEKIKFKIKYPQNGGNFAGVEVDYGWTSINMDNAQVPNNALGVYGATKYLDSQEAMNASDNAVAATALTEGTKREAIKATPTLVPEGVGAAFSPAVR